MLSDPCSELLSLLELGERRPPPRVVLPGLGELEGEEKDGVHRFLAVPFAAPPCAELRWRPPQPPAPWAGVRKNPRVLPAALQPGSFNRATFDGHVIELCESCLVLNVFAPPPKPAEPGLAPLIFYIHGGAGKFGTCHDAFECSGQELARQHGICYVSPNYRLGALGFLAHPSLLAEDEQAASDAGAAAVAGCGNFAVCDLVRALEFVREHARSFGGDPNNVTIWGLSTGSQLVHALLNCPPAAGLFHRAVMQSCTDLPNCRSLSEPHFVWQNKTAVEWGVALASRLGCGTSEGGDDPLTSPAAAASQMAALRRVSAARINVDEGFAAEAMDCYEPAIDKRGTLRTMKPLSALEMLQKGQVHRVPVMLGVTAHDGLGKCELEWTMLHGEPTTVSAYDDLLRLGFGPARLEDAKRFWAHERGRHRQTPGRNIQRSLVLRIHATRGRFAREALTWCLHVPCGGARLYKARLGHPTLERRRPPSPVHWRPTRTSFRGHGRRNGDGVPCHLCAKRQPQRAVLRSRSRSRGWAATERANVGGTSTGRRQVYVARIDGDA